MRGSVAKNMFGLKFGRLTVIARIANGPEHARWQCRCDCGSPFECLGYRLRNGSATSCGCLARETISLKQTKHGEAGKRKDGACPKPTPEYRAWMNMQKRCYNPRTKNFKNWGGRGIKVCKRWRDSFENFLADMGRRPSDSHSMDRYPDNDGDYKKRNCRWATAKEQRANQRM